MRNETVVLLIVVFTLASVAAGASQPAVTSYTWSENFEGPDLGQFASYPPVQDVGYDPSLAPAVGSPTGRALMRVVKPNRAGEERFGFIRALDLLTASAGGFSFAYRLDFAGPGDILEVGLAGADAKRYCASIPIEASPQWHTVKIPASQLRDAAGRSAPPRTGIEALWIVAKLSHASPDVTYRFLIDNLRLDAAREMRFEVRAPRAVPVAHWRELFATASLEVGRPLPIEASAPVPLTAAEIALEDQDGHVVARGALSDDGSHGDRSARDGVWSGSLEGNVNQPGAGVYTLVLHGTAKDGQAITTRVRMLRNPPASHAHPRLFFGPQDRQRLVDRTRDPRYAAMWHNLQERARSARGRRDLSRVPALLALLDPVFLLPTLPGYFSIVDHAGECAELNALEAYLTEDPEALSAAKAALLAIADWETWTPPWFPAHGQHTYYPAGQLTERVAFAYDVLHDRLTPDERNRVRRALLNYGIGRTYREYVADNRIVANTSNWIGHTVGGALVAAASIWGEADDPDLPLQTNGLLQKFEDHLAASYLADGSYGEGISYQEFDLESTTLALSAIERVLDVNYWDRSYVKESLSYPLATLADPVRGSLDTGDSHFPGGYTSAPLVARLRDPSIAWYYGHFEHRSFHDFLFADLSLPAQAPPPPGSRYFPQKGNVVFRSGWGENDEILLFRAGPNFNHNHADQGSFLLRAFGENLVREAGPAHYYQDPYYDSFFKQASGHNTVLVDHDPESQEVGDTLRFRALDRYPRITDVLLSPSVNAVSSELQQVYRGRLRSYHRRILMVPPDYVVICDDLAAARTPAHFEWRVHLPDLARIKVEGQAAFYSGPKAALAVRALSPGDAAVHVESGHLPYSTFNPAAPQAAPANPAILEIRAEGSPNSTRFLVVLEPSDSEPSARESASNVQPIHEGAWDGFQTKGSQSDLVLFRKSGAGENAYAAWSTDAEVWLARRGADRYTILSGQHVTRLQRDGHLLFSSDRAVSFTAQTRGDRIELAVSSAAPATGKIARPDGSLAEWSVAAGQHYLAIP